MSHLTKTFTFKQKKVEMIEVTFIARKLNSIGGVFKIKEWVKNDPQIDELACRVELSKKYEHISNIEKSQERYKSFLY
ncbi:MAG: hypothetical protein DWQ49_15400 [Bacteroidetes bacterium]|nr:MAG: hypothetical protein DWQ49_15400 [Bacteroidota bacterium]